MEAFSSRASVDAASRTLPAWPPRHRQSRPHHATPRTPTPRLFSDLAAVASTGSMGRVGANASWRPRACQHRIGFCSYPAVTWHRSTAAQPVVVLVPCRPFFSCAPCNIAHIRVPRWRE